MKISSTQPYLIYWLWVGSGSCTEDDIGGVIVNEEVLWMATTLRNQIAERVAAAQY
ncbi:MAG: hypothetical protein R3C44_22315 [Chloroflexota bacterium]